MHSRLSKNWSFNPWRVFAFLVVIGIVTYCLALGRNQISEQSELLLSMSMLVVATSFWLVREKNYLRLLLFSLTAFGGLRLIVWRILYTMNFTSTLNALGSLALLFGELYAVFVFLLVTIQNLVLERPKLAEESIDDSLVQPLVDVLICTFNEPIEVVRRTVSGAVHIDYANKRIHLCDDGRRAEMKRLARDLECNYITRPDNKFAKSGNINNALKQINGELILFLDADHIPCTSILKRSVPQFKDPKVGIVQFAHRCMNPAPIQRNLRLENVLPEEQEMFFQVSMLGKEHWNAAIFAGSSGLIRRSVLDELGGMSQETVIEDCEFSIKMHAKGYRSLYFPEPQSIALSPETLAAYFIQQNRWSRGQTQMLMLSSTSPFLCQGLTLGQRVSYLSNNIHYLFGLPRLIYIVIPALFLLLGVSALSVSFAKYAIFAAPYLVISCLSQNYIFKNFRHSFWSDVFEITLAPFLINWTSATLIEPRAPKFHVTPKGMSWDHLNLDTRLVWPHALLLLLCLSAFLVGLVKLLLRSDPFGVLVNVCWDAYNIITLTCAILSGLERPQLRANYRVRSQLPVTVSCATSKTELPGITDNLNESGARIRIPRGAGKFTEGDQLSITFRGTDGLPLNVRGTVLRTQTTGEDMFFTIEFDDLQKDPKKLSKLIAVCYCSAETWAVTPEPEDSLWQSFCNLVATPTRVIEQARSNGEFAKLSIFVPRKVLRALLRSGYIPLRLKPYLIEVGHQEVVGIAAKKD